MLRSLAPGGAVVAAILAAGCRPGPDPNTLTIDGSTTAYPIVGAMGEDFGSKDRSVEVVVNRSGTGSGFQKFERGEIDIATASRPIKPDEDRALARAGIDYIELPIAFDGVSIVVNSQNTWVKNLTIEQLRKAWAPGSPVKTWHDIDPSFPGERINFYGPSDNHGTFEYFTETVVGRIYEIRADYQPNPEYTAIVQAVAGDRDGMAYIGYSYFDTNRDKIRALRVNGVSPSEGTIRDGEYAPLARPLFLYVSRTALREKPVVRRFLEYAMSKQGLAAIAEARYVALPDEAYDLVRKRISACIPGSLFVRSRPGLRVESVLARELELNP